MGLVGGVNFLQTLAAQFPEVEVGCRILSINGAPTPPTFQAAKPMLQRRPLSLEFSRAQIETDWAVSPPVWQNQSLFSNCEVDERWLGLAYV